MREVGFLTVEYDEKALLSRAKKGDADAFALLLKKSERTVYNLAYRMCGNEEDALDISQEAYLRAWKSLSRFEGTCSFASWMYTLTRNVCIDHAKKEQKLKTAPLTYEDQDGDESDIPLPDTEGEQPEHVYEKKERAEAVRAAIAKLPELQREVLMLYDIEGFSYSEISGMLCIDEGTVKSRLWRARKNIKKLFEKSELFP